MVAGPANLPVRKFPFFTHLPSDIRTQIWSDAILEELGAGLPARSATTRPPILKKATTTPPPTPKPAPKPGPTAPTAPKPLPRLHIIPFHKLPNEEPFTNTNTYLTARYGANWAELPAPNAVANTAGLVHEGHQPPQLSVEAVWAWQRARTAEAQEAVWEHARSRIVLMPPGRAPGTGAQFSGGWCRGEVAGSCAEATAAADALGRSMNGGDGGDGEDGEDGVAMAVGREALIGLGKGDVCGFVNVRADGSPIGWRDMLKFWKRGSGIRTHTEEVCGQNSIHDHLSPFPGGEEWIGIAREGGRCDDGMLAGASGLRGLLPALAQCEVLVGVWHPAMCRNFEARRGLNHMNNPVRIEPPTELCAEFKRGLESLPVRYPRLKTIYIIDPTLKPRPKDSLNGPWRPRPKFRGRNVTFYSAFFRYFMSGTELEFPDWHRGQWRAEVRTILKDVTVQLDRNRQPIHMSVLACVPDDDEQDDPWGTNHE